MLASAVQQNEISINRGVDKDVEHMYNEIVAVVVQLLSHVSLLFNPMDCSSPDCSVHGTFQQEYWRGVPFPSPEVLLDPGVKPVSPAWQMHSLTPGHQGNP